MKQIRLDKETDSQLLLRFSEGRDQRAFTELIRRHSEMVRGTARRILKNRCDCEDVEQITFLALAGACDKLLNKAAVPGWLHQTAYRAAIEIGRGNSRWETKRERMKERAEPRTDGIDVSNPPDERVADAELATIVDRELALLPPELHTVVVLCDLEGNSQASVAKELGISTSTLNDRLAKARKILRDRLIRSGVTLSLAGLATVIASSCSEASTMNASVAADLAAKSTLYAAGHQAAQIGVSSIVFQSANKVISAMNLAKATSIGIYALAILGLVLALPALWNSNVATAGTLFIDSFDDGVLSDGDPVQWTSTNLIGDANVEDGILVLSENVRTGPLGVAIDALGEVHQNVSIRTETKVTKTRGSAILNARVDPVSGRSYFATLTYNPQFGGSFITAGRSTSMGVFDFFIPENGARVSPVNYDVREEFTSLQLDVIDDRIRVWAWRPGEPFPESPIFDVIDNTHSDPGFVGVGLASLETPNSPDNSKAMFRFVHVADGPIHTIPEPATAALGLIGLAGLLFIRRQTRYGVLPEQSH